MGRGKVLEAAEDVGDGVGGHAGKVLPVSPELVAEPANNEELSYNISVGIGCVSSSPWQGTARTRDHAT